ncbi:MAG TPA: peptidase [Candidatus Aminicenantes bacterium]|nr:peptidase [Candidatus Aminicenantes bacterium]
MIGSSFLIKRRGLLLLLILLLTWPLGLYSQNRITPPQEHFGFNIGDDYCLANYTQMVAYWKKLAQESPRLKLTTIGRTAEGRPMIMAIITSPENHKNLDRYKEISRRLALAEGLTDEEARALAAEGKAVVWIDGGLHGTEVLGAQHLIELVYQMVSRNDEETLRILNDVILLVCNPNPDGMELVSNWYMRHSEPQKRTLRGLPRLYHKYIGHDNNRDFYMVTQPETEAVCRVFYHEWFPQIVYNHHQTGPAGTVLFAPPFRDPFNYVYDPLIPLGIELVGTAMHARFVEEGKPGAIMRSGAPYSTWWNGGLRTTVYFHNMIGILTETIGSPTPMEIPFRPEKLLPRNDYPFPIWPQKWHFRQSVEYALTADRAVLDVASKHREEFLYNIYQMGRNSILKGSRDNWTIVPRLIQAVQEAIKKDKAKMVGSGRNRGYPKKYLEMLRDPAKRDPRGYIIPADQVDFLTATKFVNALIKTGIVVHRATSSFEVQGKTYPAGSYVIKTAQAFRPHLLSMFEPQNHPDDRLYPGGPPNPPYDSAGWTLAYQMGVEFDRILDGFEAPVEKIEGLAQPPAGKIIGKAKVGWLLDHRINDAALAVNRLLQAGARVAWLTRPYKKGQVTFPPGSIFIEKKDKLQPLLEQLAAEVGLNFYGVDSLPQGMVLRLGRPRIGLWDRYGGSMASGWVRWLLEQYEFDFEVVFPPRMDAGNLKKDFDVLIFVSGGIPRFRGTQDRRYSFFSPPKPEEVPEEYRSRLGSVTVKKTIPQLKKFLEAGGTILTIGSSTDLAYHLHLPVLNALTEKLPEGGERPLPRDKFFIPGSILQVRVDNTQPLAYGLPSHVDVYFNRSPAFRLAPAATLQGFKGVAWVDSDQPLRSGWAWGQHYLKDTLAVVDCPVGQGRLYLFGPEITFRGQPHATFKFLFNGLFLSHAQKAPRP